MSPTEAHECWLTGMAARDLSYSYLAQHQFLAPAIRQAQITVDLSIATLEEGDKVSQRVDGILPQLMLKHIADSFHGQAV